jgi:hypothetical protein
MNEKVHLERTEAGGQITWIPRSRIFVTIQEFEEKEKECEMAECCWHHARVHPRG